MATVGWVLASCLLIYEWILIARAVLSWVVVLAPRWTPRGAMLLVSEAVYTVTDPPLRLLKRFIKPWRLGGVSLDIAFIVLFIIVIFCARVVGWIFV